MAVRAGHAHDSQPLGPIRVLEVSDRIAGAYCGKMLRDAGADVVVAEPADGSPLRRLRTVGAPARSPRANAPLFEFLSGGKRSVLTGQDGSVPAALLRSADIVILTMSRDQAARHGIAVDELTAEGRRVIVTISDFGWTGPWAERAASEFTLQAWCGSTGSRGAPELPPISVGGDLGEYIVGAHAAFLGLAVHYGVERGGNGTHLDVSALEAMTTSMQPFEWLHKALIKLGAVTRSTEVPSIEQAADGAVGLTMITGQQWLDFAAMIERPELVDDPQMMHQLVRWAHRDQIRKCIRPWFAEHTVAEIVDLANAFRIPASEIGHGATLLDVEHFAERNIFLAHPAGFRAPRAPWLMSRASPRPPKLAPSVGSTRNGSEAVWSARVDACPGGSAKSAPPAAGFPLAGLRILDLTNFWAGPAATQMFGHLGADVIKVESVQRPDGIRYSGWHRRDVDDWWEYSWVFQGANTDKRSVTLNLATDDGRALFEQLLSQADVLVENYSPRVLEGFGFTYEALEQIKKDLVVVRMPAFGLDGPYRDRVGFAMTMEQLGGLAWLTGFEDQPPTNPRGPCDALAGVHASFVMMAAVEYRRRTGLGQLVEIPMIESVLNATAEQVAEFTASGAVLKRRGNRGHRLAVQNTYACAGDDQWLALSIRSDADWAAFAHMDSAPAWASDPSFVTEAGRWHNEQRIDKALAGWFADQQLHHAVAVLAAEGVPVAPVVLPSEIVENVQLNARGFLHRLEHPASGPGLYPRLPVAPFGGRTSLITRPAPLLGQHNNEILGKLAGVDEQRLTYLQAAEIIGTRPANL